MYIGVLDTPYRCRLGLNYLHQNLACDILIQLCLYAVYTEGLDRLLEHDLLLRYVQTVLLVQLLSDFLGGNSAEQTAARARPWPEPLPGSP